MKKFSKAISAGDSISIDSIVYFIKSIHDSRKWITLAGLEGSFQRRDVVIKNKNRSKCPVCKRVKCIWLELKPKPEELTTEEMEKVVSHNIDYIGMIYSGHKGSASGEERMYSRLEAYADELEKRRKALK